MYYFYAKQNTPEWTTLLNYAVLDVNDYRNRSREKGEICIIGPVVGSNMKQKLCSKQILIPVR